MQQLLDHQRERLRLLLSPEQPPASPSPPQPQEGAGPAQQQQQQRRQQPASREEDVLLIARLGQKLAGWLVGLGTAAFLIFYQWVVEPAAPGSAPTRFFEAIANGACMHVPHDRARTCVHV